MAIPNQDEGAPGLSLLETGETLKPSQNKIAIKKRSFRQIGNRRFLLLCRRFPRCFGPTNNQHRNTIDDRVGTAAAGADQARALAPQAAVTRRPVSAGMKLVKAVPIAIPWSRVTGLCDLDPGSRTIWCAHSCWLGWQNRRRIVPASLPQSPLSGSATSASPRTEFQPALLTHTQMRARGRLIPERLITNEIRASSLFSGSNSTTGSLDPCRLVVTDQRSAGALAI